MKALSMGSTRRGKAKIRGIASRAGESELATKNDVGRVSKGTFAFHRGVKGSEGYSENLSQDAKAVNGKESGQMEWAEASGRN